MSSAISVQGTELYVDFTGTSPTTWALIPEVKSIGGPNETSDEIEVTHLGSVGGRREYIQGFRDTSDQDVEMNYVPGSAIQAQFLALYASGTKCQAREVWPDSSSAEYEFFLKGRQQPVAVGDAFMITATMRITGAVTYYAAP